MVYHDTVPWQLSAGGFLAGCCWPSFIGIKSYLERNVCKVSWIVNEFSWTAEEFLIYLGLTPSLLGTENCLWAGWWCMSLRQDFSEFLSRFPSVPWFHLLLFHPNPCLCISSCCCVLVFCTSQHLSCSSPALAWPLLGAFPGYSDIPNFTLAPVKLSIALVLMRSLVINFGLDVMG